MVELFCVVAAHVYIEQCIDILNVFKVNYKGYRVTFFKVSLVFFLNLIMFVTLIWFGVAGRRKFFSLISGRSQSHWLKYCSVESKLLYRNLLK